MKLKFDNEALAQNFFEDAILLGIVAPIKDYQFSWQLNQLLGFNFRLNNDLEIELNKKQRQYFFSIYEYQVPGVTTIHFFMLLILHDKAGFPQKVTSLKYNIKNQFFCASHYFHHGSIAFFKLAQYTHIRLYICKFIFA